jgi:hypothetical protein
LEKKMKNSIRFFVNLCVSIAFIANSNAQAADGFYIGTGYGILDTSAEGLYAADTGNINLQLGYEVLPGFAIEMGYSSSVSSGDLSFMRNGGYASTYNFWGLLVSRNSGMTYEDAVNQYPSPSSWKTMTGELNSESVGLFGVAKTSGNLYVKAKAGFSTVESRITYRPIQVEGDMVDINGSVFYGVLDKGSEEFGLYTAGSSGSDRHRETDFSAGIGAGYKFTSHLFAEIEFTRLNQYAEYYGLTVNYDF